MFCKYNSVMFWPDQHHAQLFAWGNIITARKSCWKIDHINVECMSHISEMVWDSQGEWHDYTQVMIFEYGGLFTWWNAWETMCRVVGSAITVHLAWSGCPGIRRTNDSYHPGEVKLSNTVCDDYLTMASTTPAIHSGNSISISETLPLVQISHTAMSLITPVSTMCTVSQMADMNARFYVLTAAW